MSRQKIYEWSSDVKRSLPIKADYPLTGSIPDAWSEPASSVDARHPVAANSQVMNSRSRWETALRHQSDRIGVLFVCCARVVCAAVSTSFATQEWRCPRRLGKSWPSGSPTIWRTRPPAPRRQSLTAATSIGPSCAPTPGVSAPARTTTSSRSEPQPRDPVRLTGEYVRNDERQELSP